MCLMRVIEHLSLKTSMWYTELKSTRQLFYNKYLGLIRLRHKNYYRTWLRVYRVLSSQRRCDINGYNLVQMSFVMLHCYWC